MGSLTVNGICRLTRDAEIRKTSNGTWYSFSICCYRRNSKEGKQTVDFFEADLYSKETKDSLNKILTKGRLLYIENGYLRNDLFKGTDGKEKNKVKIMINGFEILQDNEAVPVIEESKKPVDAVSKLQLNTTHPSDLPPPMVYNKKDEIDPAGRDYFNKLKEKDKIGQLKAEDTPATEEIEYKFDPNEEEPPF